MALQHNNQTFHPGPTPNTVLAANGNILTEAAVIAWSGLESAWHQLENKGEKCCEKPSRPDQS
jgi:hypothetical protein